MRQARRVVARIAALLIVVVALAGCAAAANPVVNPPGQHVAGFWLGLWHGLILPITLIVSWFSDHVGIYDVHNDGGWYDFGFVLGVSIIFGGSHGGRSARRAQRRERPLAEPPTQRRTADGG
jgi:hypothetical protein